MKVLVVSFLLDPRTGGGAATSSLRLCQGLMQQGVEVVALTTHDESKPRVTFENNIKIYSFRPRNLYWVGKKDEQPLGKKAIWQLIDTWNPDTYRYMRQVIRKEKPDVMHVHKLRGLSPAVWTAAKAEGCRPIIQTCRDYEIISPEGLLESKVGRMALERHWSIRPYQALRSRWSNDVDVVTAPSQFTLKTITDMGFFRHSFKRVVPNTHGWSEAELDRLATGELPENQSHAARFSLLYLGRIDSDKGVDVLCHAVAGLVNELPNLSLEIAGSGSLESAMRNKFSAVQQIRFHGHLTGIAKDELIAHSHILIMPSIVREVFGNSIVEAYAYGKPVIAAQIGGMPELVHEGVTGFLVEPGNVMALQDIIRQLSTDPARVTEMGQACREMARFYTLEAVTQAYLQAYRSEGLNG